MEELFELLKKEIEKSKQNLKNRPGQDSHGGNGGLGGEDSDDENPGNNKKGSGNGPSQEYADAWNLIMSMYDDPNISDKEINDLINQITSGSITTL
jgi:hypothetical protein